MVELSHQGITFADFTENLIGGIFLCLLVAYGVLRYLSNTLFLRLVSLMTSSDVT